MEKQSLSEKAGANNVIPAHVKRLLRDKVRREAFLLVAEKSSPLSSREISGKVSVTRSQVREKLKPLVQYGYLLSEVKVIRAYSKISDAIQNLKMALFTCTEEGRKLADLLNDNVQDEDESTHEATSASIENLMQVIELCVKKNESYRNVLIPLSRGKSMTGAALKDRMGSRRSLSKPIMKELQDLNIITEKQDNNTKIYSMNGGTELLQGFLNKHSTTSFFHWKETFELFLKEKGVQLPSIGSNK